MEYLFNWHTKNLQKSPNSKIASLKDLLQKVNEKFKIQKVPKNKTKRQQQKNKVDVSLTASLYSPLFEYSF